MSLTSQVYFNSTCKSYAPYTVIFGGMQAPKWQNKQVHIYKSRVFVLYIDQTNNKHYTLVAQWRFNYILNKWNFQITFNTKLSEELFPWIFNKPANAGIKLNFLYKFHRIFGLWTAKQARHSYQNRMCHFFNYFSKNIKKNIKIKRKCKLQKNKIKAMLLNTKRPSIWLKW